MPADEVIKLGKRLEREMAKAARDLQFERAAQLRDRLLDLRRAMTDSRAVEAATVGAPAGPERAPGRRGGGRRRRGPETAPWGGGGGRARPPLPGGAGAPPA